jgi:histidine triad (HIT) family protein
VSDCIFCAIAAHDLPADLVHEEPDVLAFRDVNPQAPTHMLVIPRRHIESAAALTADDDALWAQMLHVAQRVAREEGLERNGYRIVANIGSDGGQTVRHLHLHVLGGRRLTWPPG